MRVLLCIATTLFLAATASAADPYAPTSQLIHRANAWKPGQPIPEELLHTIGPPHGVHDYYPRHARKDGKPIIWAGDPLPDFTESMWVFDLIHNYPLIREIVFATRDDYICDLAVEHALTSGGPGRFFANVKARCAEHPEELSKPWIRALRQRVDRPIVLLIEMYTEDEQMSPQETSRAFDELAVDLRAGVPDEKAIHKCQRKYRRPDGLSRVGFNNIVILADPPVKGMPSPKSVPASLTRRLWHARTADIFIERGRNPVYRQRSATLFYWVKEAYAPAMQAKRTS